VDLTLSPSEEAFRDEVRSWLEANDPGEVPEDENESFEFARRWQRKLHEAGWAGLSWPEEYGGKGATLIEQSIFNEELARQRVPLPANVLGLVMGGPVVIAHGNEDQKERYLEPILSGEEIWCQGFSEPESGSDLASLKTRAVKTDANGGSWKVTGQKVWTTYAHEAKYCMLLARTDQDAPKHKGITYFILDMDQPNVDVRPLRQITGEAEFNEIFLEEAEIPDENIIGQVGGGWGVAITTLTFERAGLGAAAVMGLKRSMEDLLAVIRERGLDEDPVIRQRIADLQIGIEAMRLGALRALTQTMKTGIPGPEGSLSKWQWADYNQALTELGNEVLGPEGMRVGTDWSYRFLRSRANSIEGGTTEVLKNIIAERVLGLPRLR
jgi:alkylation response protein AidB-like acyl-CoA dehydrogenase